MALNLAAVVGSDWTLAASIMTFAIPVGLFVVVATILYFLYTRPHTVPGHRDLVPLEQVLQHHHSTRRATAQEPQEEVLGADLPGAKGERLAERELQRLLRGR